MADADYEISSCPLCNEKGDYDYNDGMSGMHYYCVCTNPECRLFDVPSRTFARLVEAVSNWNGICRLTAQAIPEKSSEVIFLRSTADDQPKIDHALLAEQLLSQTE